MFKGSRPDADEKHDGSGSSDDEAVDERNPFVVLKRFDHTVDDKELRRSLHVMCRLSHPNIMELTGLCRAHNPDGWYFSTRCFASSARLVAFTLLARLFQVSRDPIL